MRPTPATVLVAVLAFSIAAACCYAADNQGATAANQAVTPAGASGGKIAIGRRW